MKKILVIGSLNMDFVIETSRMPLCGETISGKSVTNSPGGKGANQAYAIGKLGGNVCMLGAIGNDSNGASLLRNLKSVSVDTSGVVILDEIPTGQAYIVVDEQGNNSIITIAGANGNLTKELIQENIRYIEECDVVVMQLEIPIDVVRYIKEIALEKDKTIILDPAPAVANLPENFWHGIDYIKPNETELSILVGRTLTTMDDIKEGAKELVKKGVKHVIVTLGEKGCMYIDADQDLFYPSNRVTAVDTTAAGDAFLAAFTLDISKGKTSQEALCFGQKISSIVVTRKGAQTSIPSSNEIFATRSN